MKILKKFQKEGVNFLTSRKTALLADDMGLGKTVQAVGALSVLRPKRALILTLASLKINFYREIELPYAFTSQILFKTTDKIDPNANVIIANYDLLIYENIRKQLRALNYGVVILDEAHVLSNKEAKRTRYVFGTHGVIRNADRVYTMTGTPVRNRPKDFYIMLKVLAPECIAPYTDYEDYALHFCGAYRDTYGGLVDRGATNIEELAERIKPFMLRRTKEDVLTELPPLIEKIVPLEITEEIEAVIDEEIERESDFNMYRPDEDLGTKATIRRKLGLAKLPQVYNYIDSLLATENKIVIFAYHRDVINAIRLHYKGYGVCHVMGGESASMKQTEVDLFVKDHTRRIFVGQYTAAGFGVDGLQKVSNNVIFAEVDWVPGNISQARDRLYRMGQTKPVVAHYLIVEGTLEDEMYKVVNRKTEIIGRLISPSNVETEISQTRKGGIIMTIENSLDRIATALEKLADLAESSEKPVKKRATKKKETEAVTPVDTVTTTAETVAIESPVDIEPTTEQSTAAVATATADDLLGESAAVYTLADVKDAFQKFISKANTPEEGVAAAKEILKEFGISRVPDIREKDFAAVIGRLG